MCGLSFLDVFTLFVSANILLHSRQSQTSKSRQSALSFVLFLSVCYVFQLSILSTYSSFLPVSDLLNLFVFFYVHAHLTILLAKQLIMFLLENVFGFFSSRSDHLCGHFSQSPPLSIHARHTFAVTNSLISSRL